MSRRLPALAALVVIAAAALAVTILVDLDGYAWSDEGFVAQDGRPHTVMVDGDGLVWTAEWTVIPACTATDGPGGPPLDLDPSGEGGRHGGGSIGDWVTTWSVSPSSGAVTLTCPTSGIAPVVVTDDPWGPAFLGAPAVRGATLLLAVLVAALGLVAATRGRWRALEDDDLSVAATGRGT